MRTRGCDLRKPKNWPTKPGSSRAPNAPLGEGERLRVPLAGSCRRSGSPRCSCRASTRWCRPSRRSAPPGQKCSRVVLRRSRGCRTRAAPTSARPAAAAARRRRSARAAARGGCSLASIVATVAAAHDQGEPAPGLLEPRGREGRARADGRTGRRPSTGCWRCSSPTAGAGRRPVRCSAISRLRPTRKPSPPPRGEVLEARGRSARSTPTASRASPGPLGVLEAEAEPVEVRLAGAPGDEVVEDGRMLARLLRRRRRCCPPCSRPDRPREPCCRGRCRGRRTRRRGGRRGRAAARTQSRRMGMRRPA